MEERNQGNDFLLEDLLAIKDELERQIAEMSFWDRHFGWRIKRWRLKSRWLKHKLSGLGKEELYKPNYKHFRLRTRFGEKKEK